MLEMILDALRKEHEALCERIKADEARSEGDPSFASDDWKRLGGNRVAEGHISRAIKALEKALVSLD